MNKKIYTVLLSIICFVSYGQVTIQDSDLTSGIYNWTADSTYILDGYVFLEAGGVLNIEAGTIIKGLGVPSTGDNTSALIISKGAKIFANGTSDLPIIFTAEFDDVNDANDLTKYDKGLWGGLIILGNAPVGVNGGTQNIEGIPSTEGRGEYGGSTDEDNSGSLKYVSIRHGGSKLEANNEINGLTLGGVGSGTVIDYIEVFSNLDDGIEIFGGTVNIKHAVVSFCGDDSYDFDQSWDGKGQFWFTLQDELSNRAGEWDGSEAADLNPKTSPILSNLTFIGAGVESQNEDGNDAMALRDDGSAKVYNSIITGFAGRAIKMDNDVSASLPNDSYQRFLSGDLTFTSSVFYDFGAGSTFAEIVSTDGGDDNLLVTHLTENGSVIGDPALAGISRTNDGGLDPRINLNSSALNLATSLEDGFFTITSYAGAFDSNENWADGWTALSQNGYFGNLLSGINDLTNLQDKQNFKVFPNPVNSGLVFIEIRLEDTKNLSLNISDMNGRILKNISKNQNYTGGIYRLTVNVNDLPNGYYVISINSENSVVSNKLIINK